MGPDYGLSDYMHVMVITVLNRFSKDFSSERMWWSSKGLRFVFGGVMASTFTKSSRFLSRLSEVPLVWAELLVPDELLVPEGMVVLVVDSDVPSSIRVVWSFRGGPRWGPRSCAM